MKRFLLSSLLVLAMGRTAFAGFFNAGTIQVPPMSADLVQVDNPNFVNKGTFSIDLSLQQQTLSSTILYSTSDTLNYTNSGTLIGIPGFDFENFPASAGVPQMAANFVNTNAGAGSGIFVSSVFGFTDPLFSGVVLPGNATVKVRATNIVDSGIISMDNNGLIDMAGKDLNLNRAQFIMNSENFFLVNTIGQFVGNFGINVLDAGVGLFGNTNNQPWIPGEQLTPTSASSSLFASTLTTGFIPTAINQMVLNSPTVYFENLAPSTNETGNSIVWRGIYLQDFSPPNVTATVHFGGANVGNGTFHIEWAGSYRDPATDQILTNYFDLSDEPADRRNTNTFRGPPISAIPTDFSFLESPTPGIFANPAAAPSYANPIQPTNSVVTNDFSFVSVQPAAVVVDTNSVFCGSPTNLPGRIQLTASDSMNLANTQIGGPSYLSLRAPNNFLGNSNASIGAAYADLNLGVTNGSLTISNLLLPTLPVWTGVPGAPSAVFFSPMAGIQAWSASYFFVDTNGVTNDVRMLLVNSAIQPTAPTLQQDVILHASNNLVISDVLNIFRKFTADSISLTVTTNASSSFSLGGQLNLLSSDILWSASLPNLQYLTNFNIISVGNLANFAGNMFSQTSDPSAATPYQAFVNHGTITADGIFVRANYFENSGTIQASPNNNGIDIGVNGDAIATNGMFLARLGPISLSANTLFLSNGVINAGQTLSLAASCFISDGYVFENQFGHITNAVLPNVVTNGNFWTVGGGMQIPTKPPTGDLLGTTITANSANNQNATITWPGEDRGISPNGYAENLAVGQLILNSDQTSEFTFAPANGNNAIYIDRLDLEGNAADTDNNGNPKFISIAPGMTVYYADAAQNGVSIAEKLNGKFGGGSLANGGRFLWVSNYAGVFSSTNISYPDGNSYIFNHALVISPDIDSDGDGTVNRDDSTPISIGTTFDNVNNGPQFCGGGGGGGGNNGGNNGGGGGSTGGNTNPSILSFPQDTSSSSGVSFLLAQGSYSGLFYDTNGVTPASSGFFTANVTSKGGLSAKLQLGTHTYSFSKPPFDTSGHFHGTVTSKGLASLTVDLQLVNNDEIVGEVSGATWTAQLLAERAPFSSKNKAPWAGTDTLLLASDTNSPTVTGDSFGTVKISTSGDVQWSGVLPDGTKVSQKSSLSKNGIWPLFAAPYNGAGSFLGWMYCTNGSDITGSGLWIVPAGQNKLYPQGLTNRLDAIGSGVSGATPFSATAVLSGPSLSITNIVTIVGKSGQSHDGTVKLSVNAKTGLFTGSVTQPGSQALSVQGAFLEKSGIGGGFFLNAAQNQGGKIYLAPAN